MAAATDAKQRGDADWHRFLTSSHSVPWVRRYMERLPRDPRCSMCHVPFAGPFTPVLRTMGYRRFERNPRFCTYCIQTINKHERGGAEIELTMFFADVRGSTPLAERLPTAEFHDVMARFYELGTRILIRNDAFIERFMGDQVVSYFIPAFTSGGHAAKAIASARELLAETGHRAGQVPWVPVGVGIHTGTAWVGTVGDPGQMADFTALGDAVNVAARLASSAGAGEVFATEAAANAAGLAPTLGERRSIEAKGKTAPLDVRVISVDALVIA
jgi:adenylate cyclase